MKHKNILVAVAILSLALPSCKKTFIELTPESTLTEQTYYQNTGEVEGGVIASYDGLQKTMQFEYQLTSLRSDEMSPSLFEGDWGSMDGFYETSANSFLSNFWAKSYNSIARANLVLKYIDNVTDAAKKPVFEGEAKFIRAHMLFNLVRLWGDVPLVTERISYNATEQFKRTPADQVYAQIIRDLEDAVAYLPASWPAVSTGRITRYAAEAMLATVHLTRNNYAAAKPLLDDVIAANAYQLLPNPADIFSLSNEMNKEEIYFIGYKAAASGEGQEFSYEYSPIGAVRGFIPQQELLSLFAPGDKRYDASITNTGSLLLCNKYKDPTAPMRDAGNDLIVIRYAEVLLMKAEVNARLNAAALSDPAAMSDQDSLDILGPWNEVRIRAGVEPYLKSSFAGSSELLQKLMDERFVEFCFENKRWYDLLRTKTPAELAAHMNTHFDVNGRPSFTMKETQALMAVPQGDIDLAKGQLTQNPGY